MYLNREIRDIERKEVLTLPAISSCFREWGGKCAICGMALNVTAITGVTALGFQFYVPLKYGGNPDVENLIPVCGPHRREYRPGRRMREEIPDIDTFADYIVVLVKSIIELNLDEKENNPNAIPLREKIKRIKRLINFQLEDIAVSLRYKPFTDWKPEHYEILVEGDNTLPDLVENLATSYCEEDDGVLASGADAVETKEHIGDRIKQLATTKQYKIIRNKSE